MSNTNVRIREQEAVKVVTTPKPQENAAPITQSKENAVTGVCPKCGAAVEPDMELCPQCGWKLVDYCTFCGAPMSPEDMDCPECGMPADGVVCPTCGTRNFRSFCLKCGKPLSRAARAAVEKAKNDENVLAVVQAIVKIAELEAELEAADEEEVDEETAQELSDIERRYLELMSKIGFTPAEKPKAAKPKTVNRSREEIITEYKKKLEDVNGFLEKMLPPAGSTPQEQRNYYTARKVAVMEIIEEKWYGINPEPCMAWECERCHVLHKNPNECLYKEFGGKWTDANLWQVVDANTEGAVLNITRAERRVYKR